MSTSLRTYTDEELDGATFWTGDTLGINPDLELTRCERLYTKDQVDAILSKGLMKVKPSWLEGGGVICQTEYKPWSTLTPGDFIEWSRTMRRRISSYYNPELFPMGGSHLASVDDYPPIRRHVYEWVVKREAEAEQALAKRAKL